MPSLNPLKYMRFFQRIRNYSKKIANKTELGFREQAKEVYKLLKLNSLEPHEYYETYKLWDPFYTWEDKTTFLSRNQFARFYINLNPPKEIGILNKHVFNVYARNLGLPVCNDLAMFHPHFGFTKDNKELTTVEHLTDFFRNLDLDEVMIKPTGAGHGWGIMLCKYLDNGKLLLNNKSEITIEELYRRMYDSHYSETKSVHDSYLIQEKIKQHPFFDQYGTSCTQTARIVTYADLHGKIHIPVFIIKLSTTDSHVDNIGNTGLAAHVDESGLLSFGNMPVEGVFKRLDNHPITGAPITGQKVPHFEKAVQLARQAQTLVPQMRTIGWDIAITDKDEVIIIEGNAYWGWEALQRGDKNGLLKGELAREVYRLMAN